MDGVLIFGIIFGIALAFLVYKVSQVLKKKTVKPYDNKDEKGEPQDEETRKPDHTSI